jgi:hypothetical protein
MKTIGLLVYDCSLVGGAERVAINMAKELSSFYKVHLISLFSEKDKSVFESAKYTSAVISSTSFLITKHFFKLSGKIKKYLKENNITYTIKSIQGKKDADKLIIPRVIKVSDIDCGVELLITKFSDSLE